MTVQGDAEKMVFRQHQRRRGRCIAVTPEQLGSTSGLWTHYPRRSGVQGVIPNGRAGDRSDSLSERLP